MNRLPIRPRSLSVPLHNKQVQSRSLYSNPNKHLFSKLPTSLLSNSLRSFLPNTSAKTHTEFLRAHQEAQAQLLGNLDSLWQNVRQVTAAAAVGGRRRAAVEWAWAERTINGVVREGEGWSAKAVEVERGAGRWGEAPPAPSPVRDSTAEEGEIDLITLRRVPKSSSSVMEAAPMKSPEVGETPDVSGKVEKEEREKMDREKEPVNEKDRLNEEAPPSTFEQWRNRPEQKRHRDNLDNSEDALHGRPVEGEWVGFEEPFPHEIGAEKGKKIGTEEAVKNIGEKVREGAEQHWVWEDAEKKEDSNASPTLSEPLSAPTSTLKPGTAGLPHRLRLRGTPTKPHMLLTLTGQGSNQKVTRVPILLQPLSETCRTRLDAAAIPDLLRGLAPESRDKFLPEIPRLAKKGYALVGGDRECLVFEKMRGGKSGFVVAAGAAVAGAGLLTMGGAAPEV